MRLNKGGWSERGIDFGKTRSKGASRSPELSSCQRPAPFYAHLIGGDDSKRSRHSACVCVGSRAGTPINTVQERSGEEFLWLFAPTKKP